jgi:hypothetical protein
MTFWKDTHRQADRYSYGQTNININHENHWSSMTISPSPMNIWCQILFSTIRGQIFIQISPSEWEIMIYSVIIMTRTVQQPVPIPSTQPYPPQGHNYMYINILTSLILQQCKVIFNTEVGETKCWLGLPNAIHHVYWTLGLNMPRADRGPPYWLCMCIELVSTVSFMFTQIQMILSKLCKERKATLHVFMHRIFIRWKTDQCPSIICRKMIREEFKLSVWLLHVWWLWMLYWELIAFRNKPTDITKQHSATFLRIKRILEYSLWKMWNLLA